MNENLSRLSDRINQLETVVTNLTESLPELARQMGHEIRHGMKGSMFVAPERKQANSGEPNTSWLGRPRPPSHEVNLQLATGLGVNSRSES